MTDILAYSFIVAMMVLFLHATTWEGMIFEGIKKIIPPKGMLYKPIYGCPICMTPWWGTVIYLLTQDFDWKIWLLSIGCASGINVISVVLLSAREFFVNVNKELEDEG